MEQESTKDLVIVRKTIWLLRKINQAWSAGHCKDTIINRMLMTKDRQWTPHRNEVEDSIRKMRWTPLKEQVMCANGECWQSGRLGHR